MSAIRAVLVRRNPGARNTAAIAGPIAIASVLSTHWSVAFFFVSILALQTTVIALAGWLTYWRARREEVDVVVDGRHVRIGERVFGPVRSGDAAATPQGNFRVDLRSPPRLRMRLEVPTAEHARTILGALGLDRRVGTSRFVVRWASAPTGDQTFFITHFAFLASLFSLVFFPWWMLFVPLLVPLLVWLVGRVEVVVGADGVHFRSIFGKRFVAHRDAVDVRRTKRGVALPVENGNVVSLDTSVERARSGVWKNDPVFDAIYRAWATARSTASGSGPVAILARGSRSTRDWIAALRQIGAAGDGGYRVAAVDERELFGVVGDAHAPSELRVAAAIALGANVDHAPRLRVAADDVADPVVRRIALAATEDESALAVEVENALAVRRAGP